MTDISGEVVRSDPIIFNRVTTSIFYNVRLAGWAIRIRYWSDEHTKQRWEQSSRTFPSEQMARDVATQLATDIGERIRG